MPRRPPKPLRNRENGAARGRPGGPARQRPPAGALRLLIHACKSVKTFATLEDHMNRRRRGVALLAGATVLLAVGLTTAVANASTAKMPTTEATLILGVATIDERLRRRKTKSRKYWRYEMEREGAVRVLVLVNSFSRRLVITRRLCLDQRIQPMTSIHI